MSRPFFFNFLELSDLFLPKFISGHGEFAAEVAAEGAVEFSVVVIHGGVQVLFALLHLEGDRGQILAFWFVRGGPESLEARERGSLLEEFESVVTVGGGQKRRGLSLILCVFEYFVHIFYTIAPQHQYTINKFHSVSLH